MRKDAAARRGYGQVAAAAVLWGCWSLFTRPSGFSGRAMAFVLFAVMTLPLPWVLREARGASRGAWIAIGLFGVFDALNAWLYFAAVQAGPLAVGVLAHYLTPLLVALTAPWITAERRSVRALISAPVSLLGLALLLGGGGGFPVRTALLGAGSAVFYAALIFASKRAVKAFSGLAVTAFHAPVSALTLLVLFRGDVLPQATAHQWALGIGGALLCGLLGTTLFNGALRSVPTPVASTLTYLEPVVAACVGYAAFGEALTPVGVLGAAVVLAAGAWVASEGPGVEEAPQPVAGGQLEPGEVHRAARAGE